MCQFGAFYVSLIVVAAVHPNKIVNKKKSRKCKKQAIKNLLFLYYIKAKCGDIADKNPNAVDDDERTFNYTWPNTLKKR